MPRNCSNSCLWKVWFPLKKEDGVPVMEKKSVVHSPDTLAVVYNNTCHHSLDLASLSLLERNLALHYNQGSMWLYQTSVNIWKEKNPEFVIRVSRLKKSCLWKTCIMCKLHHYISVSWKSYNYGIMHVFHEHNFFEPQICLCYSYVMMQLHVCFVIWNIKCLKFL